MTTQPEDFRSSIPPSDPTAVTTTGISTRPAKDVVSPMRAPLAGDSLAGLLGLLAENLDDLERARIASENRARSLVDPKVYALDADDPFVRRATALADALHTLEHGADLDLKRALRRHPLGPWVKAQVGIGEKQGARLLAAVGDPYWNTLHGRPRTVSELWAYCGYHVLPLGHQHHGAHDDLAEGAQAGDADQCTIVHQDRDVGVAATRSRGSKNNWSNAAKMRAYLVAESCIKKAHSPYRPVYDLGRAKYADAVHPVECRRCGPSGRPALAGSPLSDGHKHARAMRLVAKEILKDLWREAEKLHEDGAL